MNKKKLPHIYLFGDILAAMLVWISFFIFRKSVNDISIINGFHFQFPVYKYLINFLLFPIYTILIHYLTGFYVNTLRKTRVSIFFSTTLASITISLSVFLSLKIHDVEISSEYFYSSMVVLFLMLFTFKFMIRSIIYLKAKKMFATKKWAINTLVIGDGENAKQLISDFNSNAKHNTLCGYITIKNKFTANADFLGNISQLDKIIQNNNIEEAIVALDDHTNEKKLFEIINKLFKHNINIYFTPGIYEILTGSAKIMHLEMIPLVCITEPSMNNWEISIKRTLDILLSGLALILLSPLLCLITIKIKLDSKGPIFYKQERIGKLAKPFNIYKFRTMHVGAEQGTPKLSSRSDDRITKFGRFMRRYRFDELPQFLNILKGDMSVVGPRPERAYYIDKIIKQAPYYCLVYKIRPGLTSWGPIKIGYANSTEKMIQRLNYDIIYMENMKLINDFKIMIYTLEILFKGKGV